jgi:hypothetical protein
MKVCDLAHQLVSGLLRNRGIEHRLRFAIACRHQTSVRIAVNFGAGGPHTRKVNLQKQSQFRPSSETKPILLAQVPPAPPKPIEDPT